MERWCYPAEWEEMAWACKERAGWRCEVCGVAHGSLAFSARGEPYEVRLAAAHLDHDPWNPAARLRALCQACHLRYDASWQQRQRRLELECLRHQAWLNYQLYGWFGVWSHQQTGGMNEGGVYDSARDCAEW